ncbi:MAG TPA: hypothetical protein VM869_14360 [Enhygromyxa sp.]|nr:hypothetical protein [Enhygromyxa sp.]
MSEHSTQPSPASRRERRERLRWLASRCLASLRWASNVVVPLAIMALMVLAAVPSDRTPERLQPQRERLSAAMQQLSLSQSWSMYAPDPGKGHFYMELYAHDADGTVRKLDDSRMAEEGWGTAWAWKRTRLDIWQHTVMRRIDKTNRNRTWYLRGVCVREARRGYDVRRIEMSRVYRRIRAPERVLEGAKTLGPIKRTKAQDSSCNVAIIREMIATDPLGAAVGEEGER